MRAYSTVIVALLVVACTTLSTRAFNPNANIATGGARQRLQVARSAQVSDYTPTSTPLKSSVSRSTFIRTLSFTPLLPALLLPSPSLAVPEIFTTDKGVKYAITQKATTNQSPNPGDIIVIDYTGYLSDGTIFDATHAVGKNNNLVFKLGDRAVIPGLEDIVSNMQVGQKVQAIIPPALAYGEKGVCIEKDEGAQRECLIKPGSTLVYDVYFKKCSIPPP